MLMEIDKQLKRYKAKAWQSPDTSEECWTGRSRTANTSSQSLRKKLTSRIALLRRLAGSGWDAGVTTLRTVTLPWFIQQHITALLSGAAVLTPTSLTLPSTTRSELLRSTRADNLLQRTGLRRNGATVSLARCPMEP